MSTRNRISIRQVRKAMGAAGKGASPEEVAKYGVAPILAPHFREVASARFLWKLTEAATQADETREVKWKEPDEEARRIVKQACKGYHSTGVIWAIVAVAAMSLVLGLAWRPFGYVLPFLGPGVVAAIFGSAVAQSIYQLGSRFTRAVTVARATYAFERMKSAYWGQLSWRQLEVEVANLFKRLGYAAHATPASNDYGVDVIAERPGEKIVIQCKQYSKAAQRNLVNELLGAQVAHHASKAILICTGGFTSGAENYAASLGVELWGLEDLVRASRS